MAPEPIPPMLRPALDDDSAGFWQGCAAGELRVQRCGACGHRQFPPRQQCPTCGSFEVGWEPVSGRGTVWSFVVPHPPLLAAYAAFAPYNVVVVTLDEDPGLRMVGNLIAHDGAPINSVEGDTINIGEPVRVSFDRTSSDDIVYPRWVRV